MTRILYVFRWKFSSEDELEGRRFPARLATYPGGGYWRDLSDNKRDSKKLIKDLFVSLKEKRQLQAKIRIESSL